jgi:multidrug efflux pump subunit AcrA (membrane-fusion protein)
VYVDVPGEVREVLVNPYAQVAAGEPILRLANVDLELAISRLEGEREQMAARLTSLHERAILDDNAAQLVAHTQEALAALGEQLQRKRTELQRLTILAPASGTLTPPAPRTAETDDARLLPNWSGHPLEVRNVGARLETGVTVGQIGDPSVTDVVLAIDETEIDFVRTGQIVDIVLDQLPGQRLRTTLATLSAEELAFAPRSLSAKHGGILATRTDAQGREIPLATTYQAGAPLENAGGRIIAGARGQARIYTGTETLGRRVWREACRTLAWDL